MIAGVGVVAVVSLVSLAIATVAVVEVSPMIVQSSVEALCYVLVEVAMTATGLGVGRCAEWTFCTFALVLSGYGASKSQMLHFVRFMVRVCVHWVMFARWEWPGVLTHYYFVSSALAAVVGYSDNAITRLLHLGAFSIGLLLVYGKLDSCSRAHMTFFAGWFFSEGIVYLIWVASLPSIIRHSPSLFHNLSCSA